MQRDLYLTVGLPRSGKTTWAQSFVFPVVNSDAVRWTLSGSRKVVQSAEGFVWGIMHLMVGSLFDAGHSQVIVDATNATKARRARWSNSEWATTLVYFDASIDECIQRADGDQELIDKINQVAMIFEPPDRSEGFKIWNE